MDINADGYADILSGCYSQCGYEFMVGSFWVLFGNKEGKFAKPVELKGSDGKTLMIRNEGNKEDLQDIANICTRPYAADVNGDGKLDIVSGNFQGTFYFFAGEGKGVFNPKCVLLADESGEELRIHGMHSDPILVDWDGDGDLDLLSGSTSGEIAWAENKSTKGQAGMARFGAFATLIAAPALDESGNAPDSPGYAVRIHVADINGDGKLDILAGDSRHSGGEPRKDLTEEETKKYKTLQDEMDKVSEKYQEKFEKYWKEYEAAVEKAGKKLTDEEQAKLWKELVEDKMEKDEDMKAVQKRMSELQEELDKYVTPWVSTGNVWVYTQK